MKSFTTKIEIVNILFSIFNAENDAPWNITLAAINGVMKATRVQWVASSEVFASYAAEGNTEGEEKLCFFMDRVWNPNEGTPAQCFFEYLVNNEACDIDAFAEACFLLMDFSFVPVRHHLEACLN